MDEGDYPKLPYCLFNVSNLANCLIIISEILYFTVFSLPLQRN